MVTQKILCPCEEEFEISYEQDQELTSDVVSAILEGGFQSYPCTFCRSQVKTELETRFLYQGQKIYYYPQLERNHYLSGKLGVPDDVYRVCFGYQELAEKVKILSSGLSDEVIEILKYLYLEKNGQNEKVSLHFHQLKDEKVEFYIQGLKEKEVGITGVPNSFYQKIAGMMLNPPEDWLDILRPPYLSIEKIALEPLV